MAKITITTLQGMKRAGHRIAALTAYDAPFARIMDEAGVDVVLVGDSVGMAALGRRDTLSVTIADMIHHAKAVTAAVQNAMVVVDMPFMSFQVSAQKALENAGRIMQESGWRAGEAFVAGAMVQVAMPRNPGAIARALPYPFP